MHSTIVFWLDAVVIATTPLDVGACANVPACACAVCLAGHAKPPVCDIPGKSNEKEEKLEWGDPGKWKRSAFTLVLPGCGC
jgi:hypothetical protein